MDASASTSGQLAYEERGAGVPVVFIHGVTFSRRTWEPILDRLDGRCRCVAIDLPGHGDSAGLPESLAGLGAGVHGLLAELGVERPVLVGHSFGALLATMYAAAYPVLGVVNIDQPLQTRPFVGMLQQMAPALRGPDFMTAFAPIRQSIGVERLPEPLRAATLATQTVRQELILAYWREPLQRSPDDVQAELEAAVRRLIAPYLAVFGRRLGAEERAALHALMPGIQLEEWPDCGHMVHLIAPDRFAERLMTFVDACAAPLARGA